MKNIFVYDDPDLGKSYIVIPKIREISQTLGNVVITFDNGDKHSMAVANPKQTIEDMLAAIEAFYA